MADPIETKSDVATKASAEAGASRHAEPGETAVAGARATAGNTAVTEDFDDQPFDLRAALERKRREARRAFEMMTVPQMVTALGAGLMGLGLVVLPAPVESGHLMLAVGAIILVLAVAWGPSSARMADADEPGMGHLVGIVEGLERKIEQLKDTQWELNESEFRYRDLLDEQDDVILRRDATGKLTFVNRAFSRVFGVDGEALLGQPFRPIVHEGEEVALPTLESAKRCSYTQRIETALGARWFVWDEHVIPATDDHPLQVQCVGRDITRERLAQVELAEARDAAQAASRAKSRFLAVMSHEIRTPMNGILGMTSLLEETSLTAEQQTYTRAVSQSARTLLGIIDEILDFSKIEAGKLDLRHTTFALDEAVQGVVELLAPRAHEKGLEMAWSISPSLPRMVIGDDLRLRQILMNLIGNAIKFTDSGGIVIDVSAGDTARGSDDAVQLAISIKDTGIGIAPPALGSIFSEFEQADPSRTRRHAGTGLGLAISRHLAEAMGGSISAESQLGAGSTFTLRITFAAAHQKGSIAEALEPLRSSKRVLLMLDMPIEAEAMAATLRSQGNVVALSTPEAARTIIADAVKAGTPYDVLMVGAGAKPDEAGGMLDFMRSRHPDGTPGAVRGIVAVKACERENLKAFRSEGFAGYLVRPVRAASLLAQVGVNTDSLQSSTIDRKPGRACAEHAPSADSTLGERTTPDRKAWRPNVLLAEDNEIGALLARAMLDKSGCDVTHARTGEDAVQAFQQSVLGAGCAFDLILMDVHMPIMDGLEAARRIRALQLDLDPRAVADDRIPSPPIIALTANAFSEDRVQCLEAGMVDYLAKPFVKAELMALIDKWCRPRHLGRGHGTIEEDAA